MKFCDFFHEKVKIPKILCVFDQKWAFFTKNWIFSKYFISYRLFDYKAYDAEIWSGCSPDVTQDVVNTLILANKQTNCIYIKSITTLKRPDYDRMFAVLEYAHFQIQHSQKTS